MRSAATAIVTHPSSRNRTPPIGLTGAGLSPKGEPVLEQQAINSSVDNTSPVRSLRPFEVLYDGASGEVIPLPERLSEFVGPIRFPARGASPYVVANFVSTIDGVVALNSGGKTGGGDISAGDAHDRLLMGVLRAMAGVIVIGSGTLRGSSRHHWAPDEAAPAFESEFRELRSALGLPARPTVAVVSASGHVDLDLPLFADRSSPSLIITSEQAAPTLRQSNRRDDVEIVAVGDGPSLSAQSIIAAVAARVPAALILTEGGPRLMASFFAERAIDELFLTIAPQIAGRDRTVARPALVEGRMFAPVSPLWSRLLSVRRSSDFLYLRYGFDR